MSTWNDELEATGSELTDDELQALRTQLQAELDAARSGADSEEVPQVQSGRTYGKTKAPEDDGTVTRDDGRTVVRHDVAAKAGFAPPPLPTVKLKAADVPAVNELGQPLTPEEKWAALWSGAANRAAQ